LELAERYVELALRLAKHEPDLVFGYCGPLELSERIDAEDPLEPARLREAAAALLDDVERSGDGGRQRWLAAQTRGLLTFAKKLAGAEVSYRDEVRVCYAVEPRWYPETELEQAHLGLDEALGGNGDLASRYARWLDEAAIPPQGLHEVLTAVAEDFRERTRALFGLPGGESVELRLVSGKRWGGYSEFVGGLRSILHVNTDLPLPACDLAFFVAHEIYPGHHTENAWKEALLVRGRGQLEATIVLASGSEAVVSEGLAQLAADVLLGDEEHEVIADHLQRLGIDYDAEVGACARTIRLLGSDVAANLALMLHDGGAGEDELREYARRWTLQPEDRIEKLLEWVGRQSFRGYVVCYPEGLRLARAFLAGDPKARFKRLLTEQLVPADLAASN
jgi:hypothetical protein